jgi:16S rRNA (cytosine967-C5)-methyltransferase
VNAILRKVSAAGAPDEWPSDAVRLSYPDWIVDRLITDLGREPALIALEAMNLPAEVSMRDDGYIQDPASQEVAGFVGGLPGERVLDVCAAPGGKATAIAATGAVVVASDLRPSRAKLVRDNATRLGLESVPVVVADGRRPPFPPASFDRVLVDAPCTGLGVLRRRPDARWRIEEDDVERLVTLQRALLDAAIPLVRPGGLLVYSVCTLTNDETIGIDEWLANAHPELEAVDPPGAPWTRVDRGARRLPDEHADGMYVIRLLHRSHPARSSDLFV